VAQAALDVLRARCAQIETGARPEEITQSEQLVRQTKASWETSLDNYMRLKNLKERDFISQQRLDEAMLQVTLSLYRSYYRDIGSPHECYDPCLYRRSPPYQNRG